MSYILDIYCGNIGDTGKSGGFMKHIAERFVIDISMMEAT
jgi:hypothetical protein